MLLLLIRALRLAKGQFFKEPAFTKSFLLFFLTYFCFFPPPQLPVRSFSKLLTRTLNLGVLAFLNRYKHVKSHDLGLAARWCGATILSLACVLLSCGPVFISRSAQFRIQDRRSCNLGQRVHVGQCVCTQRHTQTHTHRAHKPCFPPCSSTYESDLPTIMLESSKSLKTGKWTKPHTPKGEGQEAGHLLYIRIQAWTLIRTEVQHDTPWVWMGASPGDTAGS